MKDENIEEDITDTKINNENEEKDIESVETIAEPESKVEEITREITAQEEIDRLESIPESSPDYNVTRTYLNWMIQLPWNKSTEDKADIKFAKDVLAKDHYGLEKPKERIPPR